MLNRKFYPTFSINQVGSLDQLENFRAGSNMKREYEASMKPSLRREPRKRSKRQQRTFRTSTIMKNMTSFTKPEVHYVLQCRQRWTMLADVTCTESWWSLDTCFRWCVSINLCVPFLPAPPCRITQERGQTWGLIYKISHAIWQSYDYLTIMPNLRSTYDGRLIYQTSYEKHSANSYVRFTCKIVRSSEIVFMN